MYRVSLERRAGRQQLSNQLYPPWVDPVLRLLKPIRLGASLAPVRASSPRMRSVPSERTRAGIDSRLSQPQLNFAEVADLDVNAVDVGQDRVYGSSTARNCCGSRALSVLR